MKEVEAGNCNMTPSATLQKHTMQLFMQRFASMNNEFLINRRKLIKNRAIPESCCKWSDINKIFKSGSLILLTDPLNGVGTL